MRRLAQLPLLLIAALIVLPVLAVLAAALQVNAESLQILQEMAATVLPQYALTSIALCLMVGLGVALLGSATACAVTLFDFYGRKTFEWALLLPLAMPAYVVAYAYTDFLQYAGPAQSFIRSTFNVEGRVLPEVRSLGGAVLVFVVTLYPYVYLLARAALAERATLLMEAARLLGAPLKRRIQTIALPLARPAIAAGVALALMETLADFGVSSYFGIQTFTAGIYKAWLAMDNRIAAAQLATALLVIVAVLLKIERHAQKRMRFASSKGVRAGSAEARPVALRGQRLLGVWLLCGIPVLLGFVLPVLFMLRPLVDGWNSADAPLPWAAFGGWAFNSVKLAGMAAVLAVGMALAMDNRIAAAQLAAALLIVVAVLLKIERHAQKRMRFASSKGARAGSAEARPVALRGQRLLGVWLLCGIPVLLGFVLPVLFMLRPLVDGWNSADAPLPWAAFGGWAFNSVKLAGMAAVLAVGMALAMAFAVRRAPNVLTRAVVQLAGMGYAVPGAVIVVGLLIPVGALQAAQPTWGVGYVVTATVLGVVWAYLVRFSAVALQSVQSGYSRVPLSMDDSARTLGVTGYALMRRVHWPLLRRSTLVATLLVFVDVMKELPATLVLRPFNHDTLAVMAYQLARDERLGEAALPCLALVVVGLVPVMLLSRSLRDKA